MFDCKTLAELRHHVADMRLDWQAQTSQAIYEKLDDSPCEAIERLWDCRAALLRHLGKCPGGACARWLDGHPIPSFTEYRALWLEYRADDFAARVAAAIAYRREQFALVVA